MADWLDTEVAKVMRELGVDEDEAQEIVFQRGELEKDRAEAMRNIFKGDDA